MRLFISYNKNLRETLEQNNIPFDHAAFVPISDWLENFLRKSRIV